MQHRNNVLLEEVTEKGAMKGGLFRERLHVTIKM